jgi:hypothetical protein
MDSFQEINEKDRKTVILVTHDAKYLPYAHRVFYMRDGRLRRIVVNPEKQQVKRTRPGETIVTEIEQLARMYPYAEPVELKVKSVVNFVTQDIGFSQLQRLENAILFVLKGTMNDQMFAEFLAKPFHLGGAGIPNDQVAAMTHKVFGLIRYSLDVQRFRSEMHADQAFMHQQKFVDRLLAFLREEVGFQCSQQQLQTLREAVADRVGGIIDADQFAERLILTPELGGISIEERTAYKIAVYLEKLIAQGGYVILPNELEGAHT